MSVQKILLIRHAEKPALDGSDVGVNEFGQSDARDLSVRGWQRAGALVRFFDPPRGQPHAPGLALPEAIFAPAAIEPHDSVRPQHTVAPLARSLDLEVHAGFEKTQVEDLAREVMAQPGRTVLICWEHKVMPALAGLLTGGAGNLPPEWPADRFDLVWVFDRLTARSFGFSQVPQFLLARDSDVAR